MKLFHKCFIVLYISSRAKRGISCSVHNTKLKRKTLFQRYKDEISHLYPQIGNDKKGNNVLLYYEYLIKLKGDISTPLRSAQYDVVRKRHPER